MSASKANAKADKARQVRSLSDDKQGQERQDFILNHIRRK